MVTLYITSLVRGTGKTALSTGIGRHLLREGKKVGFFKVILGNQNQTANGTDSDAAFMQRILLLEEPVEQICPVFSDSNGPPDRTKKAFDEVSKGKDVMIVEGEANPDIAKALGARVIIVDTASESPGDALITAGKSFGDSLLGVVLNKVPEGKVEMVSRQARAKFSSEEMNVLAVLPENHALFTLTIGEVAKHIQGEFLNNADKSEELMENLMLGALTVDTGPLYYERKSNKVAILRSERSDMQLAALQTPTRCLVLSGNRTPLPQIMSQAEDKEVPIIQTEEDIATIISNIENALANNRFNQENKLPILTGLIEQHFDFPALYRGAGLTT
ncbi:MAG: phosphotransacetylase family protein [Dehalococcoidales bacterium]|nr:MAG: phosphotransacetylase family protein [Dehalococcoidales bacterium]